jgi:hypothetical protein
VKINDYFEPILGGPTNSFGEVGKLSLDKRFTTRNIPGPVTNGEADVIESFLNVRVMLQAMRYGTHPAAAMAWKSDSVIHVFQWF